MCALFLLGKGKIGLEEPEDKGLAWHSMMI
jgi:hypothetical protein